MEIPSSLVRERTEDVEPDIFKNLRVSRFFDLQEGLLDGDDVEPLLLLEAREMFHDGQLWSVAFF